MRTSPNPATDESVIRPYRPSDRDDFLALYELVFGEATGEWFDWKYVDNPYLDHVPMTVAETDGRLVGAKPSLPLRLSTPEGSVVALQPCDAMVHPDHRCAGLFSRMTERLVARYEDRDPAVCFNFPNRITLTGARDHGWQVVESVPTHYRIQNPATYFEFGNAGPVGRALGLATTALTRGYLSLCDWLRPPKRSADDEPDGESDAGFSVRHHADVPVEEFADLSESVADRLHVARDATFYGWRFENPRWSYTYYTAERAGETVAGLVIGTKIRDGTRVANVADVVPLTAGHQRPDAVAALLEAAVECWADADVVSVVGNTIPEAVLSSFGFHADVRPPLSLATVQTTMAARPLDGDGWLVGGLDARDPSNWAVAAVERDTD